MRFIAVLSLCLLVPFKAEAKPTRHAVDEFKEDRWEMVAQAGTTAVDVNRAMRCPAPLASECRKRRKSKSRWKRRHPAPGVVSPVVRWKAPQQPTPLPRARPAGAPEADEEAAATNAAWERIAVALREDGGPPRVVPLVRMSIFEGLAREIGRALPPTIKGYVDSLVRPVGSCREFASLDGRVKQIVADAARFFHSPALMTSCYRSAAYNRMIYARMGRRPTRSLHIARKAVDFKIAGVSKFEIAKFVRRHKFAGGVGLYCNSIVHVDVGKRRDWNWCGGVKRTRYARHGRQHYASAR